MTEMGIWGPLRNEVSGRSILRSILVNSEVNSSETGTKLRETGTKLRETGTKLSKTWSKTVSNCSQTAV